MKSTAKHLANQCEFVSVNSLGKGEVVSSILTGSTINLQAFSMVSCQAPRIKRLEPVMNMRGTTRDQPLSSSNKTSGAAVEDGVDRALRRLAAREVSKKLGPVSLCDCKKTAWAASGPWAAITDANRLPLLDMGWSVSVRGRDPACLMKRVGAETWRIHRLMVHVPPRCVVDHVNGNPLDNRTCNLRVATVAENNRNRRAQRGTVHGYRGVYLHRPGQWRAAIWSHGVKYPLGMFSTAEAAADAYDIAAIKLHGEFARLNKPRRTSV